MTQPIWNSLEVVKLAASFLTPLSVFIIGWFLNKQLKQQEQTQLRTQKAWEAQLNKDSRSQHRLTEKKIALYDQWSSKLIALYCIYRRVAYPKDPSPVQDASAQQL